jgi:hypothetical protein
MSNEERIIKNKVMLMALKSFVARANRTTGISHPSDKRCAIEIFEILKQHREPYDPDEIKSWLILKAKWKPEFAEEVIKIARGILEGKKFNSIQKGPMFNSDIIETWREESKDPQYNSEEWKNLF